MTQNKTDYENSPIAWFAVLEDAKRRNDFERAAEARRELRRLGVQVDYLPSGEGQSDVK